MLQKKITLFFLLSAYLTQASDSRTDDYTSIEYNLSSENSQESSDNTYQYDSESEPSQNSKASSEFGNIIISPRHSSYSEELLEGRIVCNSFFYSLIDTKNEDDIDNNRICVKASLFQQLCVQAFKTLHGTNRPQKPFQKLLQRLGQGIIKKEYCTETMQEQYLMTKKDLNHRLLSYIPKGKRKCLVNDKIVTFQYCLHQTERDFNQWAKIPKDDEENNRKGSEEQSIYYRELVLGKQLLAYGHDFESDKEHHASIIKEFELLLKK